MIITLFVVLTCRIRGNVGGDWSTSWTDSDVSFWSRSSSSTIDVSLFILVRNLRLIGCESRQWVKGRVAAPKGSSIALLSHNLCSEADGLCVVEAKVNHQESSSLKLMQWWDAIRNRCHAKIWQFFHAIGPAKNWLYIIFGKNILPKEGPWNISSYVAYIRVTNHMNISYYLWIIITW
jgi:hypothetical protein